MLVPALIFLACFGVGITASSRWLPELGPGPVGDLAFFAVCGLLATALSLAGLHAYSTVNELQHPIGETLGKGEILAGGFRNVLFDSGIFIGLAGALYLLAPAPDEAEFAPSDIEPSGPRA